MFEVFDPSTLAKTSNQLSSDRIWFSFCRYDIEYIKASEYKYLVWIPIKNVRDRIKVFSTCFRCLSMVIVK